MSTLHWLQLSLTKGIGPVLISRIIEAAGSAEAACQANATLLRSIEGIGTSKSTQIAQALREAAELAQREFERAQKQGVLLVCRDDADYPLMLARIPDPPAVLYVRGSIEARDLQSLAIVGSRRCTHYGREQAQRFGALLAGVGMTVLSGGARGIDSAAHRGALQVNGGRTIAVLGCGVDITYPPENAPLFDQIAANGAIISEYPLATPPTPENFPRRNRIVSGMSRGVLVVEADERSGALITARMAADDHNRPVFAVPGRVDSQMSAGTHKLLRDGAVLTANLDDILHGLDPLPPEATQGTLFDDAESPIVSAPIAIPSPAVPLSQSLSDSQQRILAVLADGPMTADRVIEESSLPAQSVMGELTFLSLRGLIKRVDGQMYVKR